MKNGSKKRTHRLGVVGLGLIAITLADLMPASVSFAQVSIPDGDVAGLIAAINAANASPGADIINLAAGGTYTLTAVNNTGTPYGEGPNGLPVITSQITINGNGATIQRSNAAGTPNFRIFQVGHLYNKSGDLTLNEVTIRGGRPGGLVNVSKLLLRESTVTENGGGDGGGILNIRGGTLTVENSTISNNTSFGGYGGGGILNFSHVFVSTTTIINSTIFENRADGPPGFQGRGDAIADAFSPPGSIVIKNSILASPTNGLGNDFNVPAGVVTSLGHNICSDASGALLLTGPGDMNSTNPLLGPLANNGGPTQTHAPLLGSPAIDAVPLADLTDANGNAITTDQRGVARPQGSLGDIGSVEFDVYTIMASAGANGSISPSGNVSVNYGGSQSFTITPNTGYHVADVLVNGSSVGAATSYTFTNVTANHTISASFAINVYTITASAGANGSISPSGAVTVNHGGSVTFTISPNANYHIADVLVDGASVGIPSSYVFSDVTASHTIAATFAPDHGTISGSVLVGTSGLANVTVKLLDNNGDPVIGVDNQSTDANGQYSFDDLEPDDYQVMIVEPLGYFSDGNPKQTTLNPGGANQVNFILTPVTITNNSRSMGYWKQQFDKYITNRGNAQETQAQLNEYISRVHQYYTPHFNVFSGLTTFPQWQAVLSAPNNASMLDKARQQLAALVMNFTSLKIGQNVVVTADGRTAGDVLTYVSTLVTGGDASKYELAKNLAEKVCTQQPIAAGIVPPGTVLYKGGAGQQINWNFDVPVEFSLLQNYPNPFNPTTTIQYNLPEPSLVTLKVYDVVGREVAVLVNGHREAGRYSAVFNATGLPSGVYVYRLQAGTFIATKRLLLLK